MPAGEGERGLLQNFSLSIPAAEVVYQHLTVLLTRGAPIKNQNNSSNVSLRIQRPVLGKEPLSTYLSTVGAARAIKIVTFFFK